MPGALFANLILAGALAVHTPAPASDAVQVSMPVAPQAALQEAIDKVERDRPEEAAAILAAAMQAPTWARASADVRYRASLLAGLIALDREQFVAARALLAEATAFPQADAEDWRNRLEAAYRAKDYTDAAYSLARIARSWPTALAGLNQGAILQLADGVKATGQAEPYRNLLEALFDARWQGGKGEPDALWMDLARLLLADGKTRKAAEVASAVHAPRQVVAMRIDRAFDPLARGDRFDVGRASAAALREAEARRIAEPAKLLAVTRLQGHLSDAGQFERVIALADQVMATARGPAGSEAWADFDEEYAWVLDARAEALANLGRWDEALRQREKAARRPEGGGMNVSQVINLGNLLNQLGRPAEARDAIEEIGSPSPFGRMQLAMVCLEAALQEQDASAVAQQLAYLREHRDDAIGTWQLALLHSGDVEGAAALLVERLTRPEWRAEALAEMQEYLPVARTPIQRRHAEQWRQLLVRPEVRAAARKVGRIGKFNLTPPRT